MSTTIPDGLFLCGQKYTWETRYVWKQGQNEEEPLAKGSLKSQKGTAFICDRWQAKFRIRKFTWEASK